MGEGLGVRADAVQIPSPPCSTEHASPLPFPQSPGESDRAFEAFRVYLELGPQRRHAAAARKVGTSLRTVERWARDFDWRGRIKACAAQGAAQYTETQSAVQRAEILDAAARAQAFRDRQYAVAEALLGAAERYLEQAAGEDLDQMKFADACKALEVASRIEQQASVRAADNPSASARTLGDQLAALLDQVCAAPPSPSQPGAPGATLAHRMGEGLGVRAGEVSFSGSPSPHLQP